jgi:hypothetical protein
VQFVYHRLRVAAGYVGALRRELKKGEFGKLRFRLRIASRRTTQRDA